jgi:hypothetical protein
LPLREATDEEAYPSHQDKGFRERNSDFGVRVVPISFVVADKLN